MCAFKQKKNSVFKITKLKYLREGNNSILYDSLKDRENRELTMDGYYLSFWNDIDIVWLKDIAMFKYQSFATRDISSLQLNIKW